MKTLNFLSLIILSIMISACSSHSKTKKESHPKPVSNQVLFIEASNDREILVRATGIGSSVEAAKQDAKKAAVWYVLYSGEYPLLTTSQAKERFEKSPQFWHQIQPYLRYVSDIKGKKQQGKQRLIDLMVRVDRQALSKYLQQQKIIDPIQNLPLPSVVIVSSSNVLQQRVNQSFQKAGYLVVSDSLQQTQQQLISDIATLEGIIDPEYQKGMASGADVVVKAQMSQSQATVSGVQLSSVSVSIEVIDSVTSQTLASGVGNSQSRAETRNILIQEAANDALFKINSQLKLRWQQQKQQGQIFKVILLTDNLTESIDFAFLDSLAQLPFEKRKRIGSGSQIVSYWLWSKQYSSSFELYRDLKSGYKGEGLLSRQLEKGRFLILKVDMDTEMVVE